MIPMPAMTHTDPFWRDPKDPHVVTYTKLTVDSPTIALYEAFNPAFAQINTEEVFSIAEFDVMKNGMAPEAAIDKAFKRIEAIFAKYPIEQA
jgi:multiple sugar transport system substrate-binding protein